MDTSLLFASNRLFDTFRTVENSGKEWLVVNGVPLVEGVLNKRFVSVDEFGAFVPDWNGIPVVLRHPKQNGGSARVPSTDVPIVGRFYNAKLDGARLVGEYWLEKQALEASEEGKNLIALISRQHPIETSTGYWSETIPQDGKWNGREYNGIDRNIHPDHIALLPDEVGACSLADGCGLNRNQLVTNCQGCQHNQPPDYSGHVVFINGNLWQNVTGSLPPEGKKMWEKVYNAALTEYDGDKEKAAATAWTAVKKVWRREGKTWVKKETKQNRGDLEGLAVALLFAQAIDS